MWLESVPFAQLLPKSFSTAQVGVQLEAVLPVCVIGRLNRFLGSALGLRRMVLQNAHGEMELKSKFILVQGILSGWSCNALS